MVEGRAETTIERSADDVWAVIGDFGNLDWFSGITSCTLEGDDRSVRAAGLDVTMVERLFAHDDDARTYSYGIVHMEGETKIPLGEGRVLDLGLSIGQHRATITVTPTGASSSQVTFDVEHGVEKMLPGMVKTYQGALNKLKTQLES